MKSLKEKYGIVVANKNSILCTGVDPAEHFMGRGDKGLPEGVSKQKWAEDYIKATLEFSSAIKPNLQYWLGFPDEVSLARQAQIARNNGSISILDAKIADIGSTSEAGIIYAIMKNFDAITIAPYAGNMDEFAKFGKKHDIGIITMCLMSSPGYKNEKNMLVPLNSENDDYKSDYKNEDIVMVQGVPHVKRYQNLALNANKFGIDGIVIGAPSANNHLKENEIKSAMEYAGKDMLVLIPGIGAQGGEVEFLRKYIDRERMIANVGRSLMFPNGSNSTPYEQRDTAQKYKSMLNSLK